MKLILPKSIALSFLLIFSNQVQCSQNNISHSVINAASTLKNINGNELLAYCCLVLVPIATYSFYTPTKEIISSCFKHLISYFSIEPDIKPEEATIPIQYRADPNARNNIGQTLLHEACKINSTKYIQALIKIGANPNAQDYDGRTPLHVACQNGSIDGVKLLLENGANPNEKDYYGNTALHLAFRRAPSAEIMKLLLEKNANLNIQNDRGHTAISLALVQNNLPGLSIIKFLLEPVNLAINPGYMAFFCALINCALINNDSYTHIWCENVENSNYQLNAFNGLTPLEKNAYLINKLSLIGVSCSEEEKDRLSKSFLSLCKYDDNKDRTVFQPQYKEINDILTILEKHLRINSREKPLINLYYSISKAMLPCNTDAIIRKVFEVDSISVPNRDVLPLIKEKYTKLIMHRYLANKSSDVNHYCEYLEKFKLL